jgi:hypothetical protein
MAATCIRTTRPATATELATLTQRGQARGVLGCAAVPAVFAAGAAIVMAARFGLLAGGVVVLVAALAATAVVVSFRSYWRPVQARIREDVASGTVEVLTIASAAPFHIPPMHSSVSPAFAFELEGGRTLVLLGQWLSEEATFGGTPDPVADDDAGDAFANALTPPNAFPTSAFVVHRFARSGEVVRIELTGPYLEPAELNLDLRPANDFPSRIYEVPPSKLAEVLAAPR